MKFGKNVLDQRPIPAQSEEPLLKTAANGGIEVMDMALDRGVHHDRHIIMRLVCSHETSGRFHGLSGFYWRIERVREARSRRMARGSHHEQIFSSRYSGVWF